MMSERVCKSASFVAPIVHVEPGCAPVENLLLSRLKTEMSRLRST